MKVDCSPYWQSSKLNYFQKRFAGKFQYECNKQLNSLTGSFFVCIFINSLEVMIKLFLLFSETFQLENKNHINILSREYT